MNNSQAVKIGIVHLVWKPLGIERFASFIASYKEHDAGAEHDLVIIFKAFENDDASLSEYYELLNGVFYNSLFLPDEGFDILPYFIAARSFNYKYFCFLNSYSILQEAKWLAKMYEHVKRADVGLVGATGSYESYYTNLLHHTQPIKSRLRVRGWLHNLRRRREIAKAKAHFDPFPNCHIRTNSFMLARDVMLRLDFAGERSKSDSLIFEAGKNGLTKQILKMNLKAIVVGRDGVGYEKERWFESHTFRSGGQYNLLIADNRTRQFAEADTAQQKLLIEYAWGKRNDG